MILKSRFAQLPWEEEGHGSQLPISRRTDELNLGADTDEAAEQVGQRVGHGKEHRCRKPELVGLMHWLFALEDQHP